MQLKTRFAFAAATLTFCALVQAQAWPAKPVKIIVPYPPGGSVDVVTRKMAAKLQEQTGQTFFVENKAGATGTIGLAAVVQAPADGYTLAANDTTLRAAAAHLQEAAVRLREGPAAGERVRLRADERGRQGRLEVQDARRPDCRGQDGSQQDHLRHGWRRDDAALRQRSARHRRRRELHAHPVQGRGRGDVGDALRHDRLPGRVDPRRDGQRQGRQGAHPRGQRQQAPRRACPTCRPSPKPASRTSG